MTKKWNKRTLCPKHPDSAHISSSLIPYPLSLNALLILLLLLSTSVLSSACSSAPDQGKYSIGRDPSWFPITLVDNQASELIGFSNLLVEKIGEKEDITIPLIDVTSSNLIPDLERRVYAGAFSTLPRDIGNRAKYSFSDPIIYLGPVLVVREDADYARLSQMKNKIIGINQFSNDEMIVQKYPTLVMKSYQNMPTALDDLENRQIDGVLLDNLDALTLLPTRYYGTLKSISKPLNDRSLRVITLKGKHKSLLRHFNNGLRLMKKSGEYEKLMKKFSLINAPSGPRRTLPPADECGDPQATCSIPKSLEHIL